MGSRGVRATRRDHSHRNAGHYDRRITDGHAYRHAHGDGFSDPCGSEGRLADGQLRAGTYGIQPGCDWSRGTHRSEVARLGPALGSREAAGGRRHRLRRDVFVGPGSWRPPGVFGRGRGTALDLRRVKARRVHASRGRWDYLCPADGSETQRGGAGCRRDALDVRDDCYSRLPEGDGWYRLRSRLPAEVRREFDGVRDRRHERRGGVALRGVERSDAGRRRVRRDGLRRDERRRNRLHARYGDRSPGTSRGPNPR